MFARRPSPRNPDGDAIRYFDGRITFAELDALTDAFAAALAEHGFAKGDRLALYLQNVPAVRDRPDRRPGRPAASPSRSTR